MGLKTKPGLLEVLGEHGSGTPTLKIEVGKIFRPLKIKKKERLGWNAQGIFSIGLKR